MKTAQKWMVATGACLGLVTLVILLGGGLSARTTQNETTAGASRVSTQAPQASHPLPPAWQLSWQGSTPATGLEQPLPPSASNPLDNLKPPVFRANPTGDLVMDPQTRTDVERLHALNERDDALAKLDALSRNLPAQARRELQELYQQHVQYSQAVTRSFPPGVEVDSVDKVLQQFEGLHELRVAFEAMGDEGCNSSSTGVPRLNHAGRVLAKKRGINFEALGKKDQKALSMEKVRTLRNSFIHANEKGVPIDPVNLTSSTISSVDSDACRGHLECLRLTVEFFYDQFSWISKPLVTDKNKKWLAPTIEVP